ncbi:hypothetical protein SNEBB_000491 [Seison nebaliae]|nr:hypothetical protein SNEBB_000491 [Seison nebaliae]
MKRRRSKQPSEFNRMPLNENLIDRMHQMADLVNLENTCFCDTFQVHPTTVHDEHLTESLIDGSMKRRMFYFDDKKKNDRRKMDYSKIINKYFSKNNQSTDEKIELKIMELTESELKYEEDVRKEFQLNQCPIVNSEFRSTSAILSIPKIHLNKKDFDWEKGNFQKLLSERFGSLIAEYGAVSFTFNDYHPPMMLNEKDVNISVRQQNLPLLEPRRRLNIIFMNELLMFRKFQGLPFNIESFEKINNHQVDYYLLYRLVGEVFEEDELKSEYFSASHLHPLDEMEIMKWFRIFLLMRLTNERMILSFSKEEQLFDPPQGRKKVLLREQKQAKKKFYEKMMKLTHQLRYNYFSVLHPFLIFRQHYHIGIGEWTRDLYLEKIGQFDCLEGDDGESGEASRMYKELKMKNRKIEDEINLSKIHFKNLIEEHNKMYEEENDVKMIENYDVICAKCKMNDNEENLLLCKNNGYHAFHTYCLPVTYRFSNLPDEWFCWDCTAKQLSNYLPQPYGFHHFKDQQSFHQFYSAAVIYEKNVLEELNENKKKKYEDNPISNKFKQITPHAYYTWTKMETNDQLFEFQNKENNIYKDGKEKFVIDWRMTVNSFRSNKDGNLRASTIHQFLTNENDEKMDSITEHSNSNLDNFVTADEIEEEYWRRFQSNNVKLPTQTTSYGADVNTSDIGSGFPSKYHQMEKSEIHENNSDYEKYLHSSLNINNIANNDQSAFTFIKPLINGVRLPWLYFGQLFSTFCWHTEDHFTYSINYHHYGAPKIWYVIPSFAADRYDEFVRNYVPEFFKIFSDFTHHLTSTIHPNILIQHGIPVYRINQMNGDFVITAPRSYHSGYNQGFNIAEAVNFAYADWFWWSLFSSRYYIKECHSNIFSINEYILYALSQFHQFSINDRLEKVENLLGKEKENLNYFQKFSYAIISCSERAIYYEKQSLKNFFSFILQHFEVMYDKNDGFIEWNLNSINFQSTGNSKENRSKQINLSTKKFDFSKETNDDRRTCLNCNHTCYFNAITCSSFKCSSCSSDIGCRLFCLQCYKYAIDHCQYYQENTFSSIDLILYHQYNHLDFQEINTQISQIQKKREELKYIENNINICQYNQLDLLDWIKKSSKNNKENYEKIVHSVNRLSEMRELFFKYLNNSTTEIVHKQFYYYHPQHSKLEISNQFKYSLQSILLYRFNEIENIYLAFRSSSIDDVGFCKQELCFVQLNEMDEWKLNGNEIIIMNASYFNTSTTWYSVQLIMKELWKLGKNEYEDIPYNSFELCDDIRQKYFNGFAAILIEQQFQLDFTEWLRTNIRYNFSLGKLFTQIIYRLTENRNFDKINKVNYLQRILEKYFNVKFGVKMNKFSFHLIKQHFKWRSRKHRKIVLDDIEYYLNNAMTSLMTNCDLIPLITVIHEILREKYKKVEELNNQFDESILPSKLNKIVDESIKKHENGKYFHPINVEDLPSFSSNYSMKDDEEKMEMNFIGNHLHQLEDIEEQMMIIEKIFFSNPDQAFEDVSIIFSDYRSKCERILLIYLYLTLIRNVHVQLDSFDREIHLKELDFVKYYRIYFETIQFLCEKHDVWKCWKNSTIYFLLKEKEEEFKKENEGIPHPNYQSYILRHYFARSLNFKSYRYMIYSHLKELDIGPAHDDMMEGDHLHGLCSVLYNSHLSCQEYHDVHLKKFIALLTDPYEDYDRNNNRLLYLINSIFGDGTSSKLKEFKEKFFVHNSTCSSEKNLFTNSYWSVTTQIFMYLIAILLREDNERILEKLSSNGNCDGLSFILYLKKNEKNEPSIFSQLPSIVEDSFHFLLDRLTKSMASLLSIALHSFSSLTTIQSYICKELSKTPITMLNLKDLTEDREKQWRNIHTSISNMLKGTRSLLPPWNENNSENFLCHKLLYLHPIIDSYSMAQLSLNRFYGWKSSYSVDLFYKKIEENPEIKHKNVSKKSGSTSKTKFDEGREYCFADNPSNKQHESFFALHFPEEYDQIHQKNMEKAKGSCPSKRPLAQYALSATVSELVTKWCKNYIRQPSEYITIDIDQKPDTSSFTTEIEESEDKSNELVWTPSTEMKPDKPNFSIIKWTSSCPVKGESENDEEKKEKNNPNIMSKCENGQNMSIKLIVLSDIEKLGDSNRQQLDNDQHEIKTEFVTRFVNLSDL